MLDEISAEIGLMCQLNHSNITRIIGATRHHAHFFMFVEWMPGKVNPHGNHKLSLRKEDTLDPQQKHKIHNTDLKHDAYYY